MIIKSHENVSAEAAGNNYCSPRLSFHGRAEPHGERYTEHVPNAPEYNSSLTNPSKHQIDDGLETGRNSASSARRMTCLWYRELFRTLELRQKSLSECAAEKFEWCEVWLEILVQESRLRLQRGAKTTFVFSPIVSKLLIYTPCATLKWVLHWGLTLKRRDALICLQGETKTRLSSSRLAQDFL